MGGNRLVAFLAIAAVWLVLRYVSPLGFYTFINEFLNFFVAILAVIAAFGVRPSDVFQPQDYSAPAQDHPTPPPTSDEMADPPAQPDPDLPAQHRPSIRVSSAPTLSYFLFQTWRSIAAFWLSFVVLGLMVVLTPQWFPGFIETTGSLKYIIMDNAESTIGNGSPSALYGLVVGDTAISLQLLMLATRFFVVTGLVWICGLWVGLLYGSTITPLSNLIWQTWRSIVSFFLSFIVLGLMVVLIPEWVTGFVETAGSLKYFIMDGARNFLGNGSASALFGLIVGDTAIALTLMTLFTRVVVLTLIMWLGGLIYSAIFGSRQSSH